MDPKGRQKRIGFQQLNSDKLGKFFLLTTLEGWGRVSKKQYGKRLFCFTSFLKEGKKGLGFNN
jgi:hypothetical protein